MQKTFYQLDQILTEYATIWRASPFTTLQPAWKGEYPELFDWLMTLSDNEVDKLQADDNLLCQHIAPYFPVAQEIYSLIQLPFCSQSHSQNHLQNKDLQRPNAWKRDVPGRKVEQIEAFVSAMGEVTDPLLEWCSGKLHLGRYLAEQFDVPVLGLEINTNLVEQANKLAQQMKINAKVEPCDVLSDDVKPWLNKQQHSIALHACGGLHVSLLDESIAQQVKRVTLAPCCYHRFNLSNDYQSLSQLAQKSNLHLTIDDLRNAVRQSNIASDRVSVKRKKLQSWRLGFDSLQRDIRRVDEYLPVPSVSPTMLNGDFAQFCEYVAQLKDLTLPEAVNFDKYEKVGERRFFEFSRFELVRMTFRRALELWLVLDRVMYLEEHGYQCSLTQFCSSDLTPRNLLIDARKEFIVR